MKPFLNSLVAKLLNNLPSWVCVCVCVYVCVCAFVCVYQTGTSLSTYGHFRAATEIALVYRTECVCLGECVCVCVWVCVCVCVFGYVCVCVCVTLPRGLL